MQVSADNNVSLSINPANGETLSSWPYADAAQVEAAPCGGPPGRCAVNQLGITRRADILRAAAVQLRAGKAELARLITLEMGKPLSEAEGEVEKSGVELRVRRRTRRSMAGR